MLFVVVGCGKKGGDATTDAPAMEEEAVDMTADTNAAMMDEMSEEEVAAPEKSPEKVAEEKAADETTEAQVKDMEMESAGVSVGLE